MLIEKGTLNAERVGTRTRPVIHILVISSPQTSTYNSYLQCSLIQSARAVFQRFSCENRLSIKIVFQLPRSLWAFYFCFSMIVANSSPLPNIDHIMCLMRGVGGRQTCGNDFLLQRASNEWMYIAGMFSCMLPVS